MKPCVLCNPAGENVVYRHRDFRVIAVTDQPAAPYFRVISAAHKKEMSDLSAGERAGILDALLIVEKVLKDTSGCEKINLASFGNQVPHVHWHVIARYTDDAFFPDSVWANPKRDVPADVSAKRLALTEPAGQAIKKALAERFGVSE